VYKLKLDMGTHVSTNQRYYHLRQGARPRNKKWKKRIVTAKDTV